MHDASIRSSTCIERVMTYRCTHAQSIVCCAISIILFPLMQDVTSYVLILDLGGETSPQTSIV